MPSKRSRPGEVLAIAVFEAKRGREAECLAVVRELFAFMRRKRYGRDQLYRDVQHPSVLLNFRWWSSEAVARRAHRDPELHAFWGRLAKVSQVKKIYERLEPV